MVTVTDFVVRLLTSVVELVVTFATEVAFNDPLTFVAFLFGTIFVVGASAVFGGLVVGALLDTLGLQVPSPGRGQRDADGRIPTARPNPEAQQEATGAARAKQGQQYGRGDDE